MPKRKKKSNRTLKKESLQRMRDLRATREFKEKEKVANTDRRRRVRQIPEVRESEQNVNTARRRSARLIPDVRQDEQEVDTARRRQARLIPDVREEEQEVDTARRRIARLVPEIHEKEKVANTTHRREVRQVPEIREKEQEIDTARRRIARLKVDVRQDEQEVDTARRRIARLVPEVHEKEKVANTTQRREVRLVPEIREKEQKVDSARRRSARLVPKVHEKEKVTNTTQRREVRQVPEIREKEQKVDSARRRSARLIPNVRENEQEVDTARRRSTRKEPEVKSYERVLNTTQRRSKRRLSETSVEDKLENAKQRKDLRQKAALRLLMLPFEGLHSEFQKEIRDTPSNVCCSCGGLFYSKGVTKCSIDSLRKRKLSDEFINTAVVIQGVNMKLCWTCNNNIVKAKIPKLCLSNGHDFPDVPPELKDLSPLEERMVALRLPFMQMRNVGAEGQSKLKGNVINVENNLDICAKVIPRRFNELSTIQVQLMRRMQYNRPYMYEAIRPAKVYNASVYLKDTELYQTNNVEVSADWSSYDDTQTIEFICDEDQDVTAEGEERLNDDSENSESDSETDDEVGSSLLDETLIYNECDYRVKGIRIAPGEGKHPIPMYDDPFCEEMAFPTIYCGKKKIYKEGVRITYTDRAKSEIRNRDRRACKPSKILYMFRRSHTEKMRQAMQVYLRKRPRSDNLTASQARDPEYLRSLMSHDEGYAVWKSLRSSPSYWQAKQKSVLAMIRQIGKCTFFITLSAAETRWPELLVVLNKLLKGTDISEETALQQSPEDKADLIRSDPVTCMRHFDHRLKEFRHLILSKPNGVFHPFKLSDHFNRIEFQMRGSPHSHGLYWIDNAPVFDEDNPTSWLACVEFIDQFITCARDEDGEMKDLLPYQIHNHSRSCRQGSRSIKDCRFDFPKPPMLCTTILLPLPENFDENALEHFTSVYENIRRFLIDRGRNPVEKMDYVELLQELDTDQEEYIMAIRSSISRPTVFLKRQVDEAFINAYNKKILITWRANMDIQFVLDTYACAKYCVNYITKSDGGMSQSLQQITREARKQKLTYREKLKMYAAALVNGTEISSQEASGFLLGLPNTSCSRQDIFVNTSVPGERIRILRSKNELDKLDEDSEDVCAAGIIEHYQQRPLALEHMCLAEFATSFEIDKKKSKADGNDDHEDDENSIASQQSSGDDKLELLNGNGVLRKRAKLKILRFRNYGKNQDPDNWAREQMMLYFPFRDEEVEVNRINCLERIKDSTVQETIFRNSVPYFFSREMDDIRLQDLYDYFSQVEADEPVEDADGYAEDNEYLLNSMMGGKDRKIVENFMPPKASTDEEYSSLMQSLNDRQRKFVMNVIHKLKTDPDPFYYFLSGGAGTGKSHVISAIVQSVLRYASLTPTEHPDQIPVIVGAPTGKAAFNVFGQTLHSLFHLPPSQKNNKKQKMSDLDEGVANTLRTMLGSCKLIIIDEISMVSVRQLYQINQRLQQIFQNNLDFGGKPVIVVGDMRQIRPVGGTLIFKQPPFGLDMLADLLKKNRLWERFYIYELEEIMRQKGDWEFCKALNNMSIGAMDDQDIRLIQSRKMNDYNKPPHDAIWLFRTNDECAEYNAIVHAGLDGEGYMSTAVDRPQGSGNQLHKARLLERAKEWSLHEGDGLPYETYLKVGGEYFISTNIDVEDGLFNGSTGSLKHIETVTVQGQEKIRRVWLAFKHVLIGSKAKKAAQARKLYDRPDFPEIDRGWVPVTYYKKKISKTYKDLPGLSVVRSQIPLIACNGMTIIKSQGSSISALVVSVKRPLTREELYVACSRATSKSGLYIYGDFKPPSKPAEKDPVSVELTKLRNIDFPFKLKYLQDFDSEFYKIYFHNIQSFRKHKNDLLADQCAMSADIIILLEPWLLSSDHVSLTGYRMLHRISCSGTRNSEGVIVFANEEINIEVSESIVDIRDDKSHCLILQMLIPQIDIVAVYKSPKYPDAMFMNQLEDFLGDTPEEAMLLGDFNMDVTVKLKDHLKIKGFDLKTSESTSTTNGNTKIDGCFSNNENVESWIYESYYSYHKPICSILKKHN